jgi:hypothetical protein
LADSLVVEEMIDAYCLACDVVWPISAEERSLVATLLAGQSTRVGGTTRLTSTDAIH